MMPESRPGYEEYNGEYDHICNWCAHRAIPIISVTRNGAYGDYLPWTGDEVVRWLDGKRRLYGDTLNATVAIRPLVSASAEAFMEWWDSRGFTGGWRALAEAMREEVTE